MSRAVPAAVLLAALWALAGGPGLSLAATDEEILEQLTQWLEEPLDLRGATAAELALLPWVDAQMARAMVGLRDAGGLRELADLEQIPGLDGATVQAIEPFVELEETGPQWWQTMRLQARSRSRTEPVPSGRWRIGRGEFTAQIGFRTEDQEQSRAWVEWRGERHRLLAGDLRPRIGSGILLSDPRSRSRTLPVSVRHPLDVASFSSGTVPSEWRGMGFASRWRRLRLLAAAGAGPGGKRALVAGEVRSTADAGGPWLGLGLVGDDRSLRGACWLAQEGDRVAWRLETAKSPGQDAGATGALAVAQHPWRLGLGWTAVPGGADAGSDPITGLRLDRPHRCLQADASHRQGGNVVSFLLRRTWRGPPGNAGVRDRLESAFRGRTPQAQWTIRVRGDRVPDESETEITLAASWRERGRLVLRRSIRLRQVWADHGPSSLLAAGVEADAPLRWRVEAAAVAGASSQPWGAALPGAGVLGPWLAPGSVGVAMGIAQPAASRTLAAIWFGAELQPQTSPDLLGGIRLETRP